MNNGHDDVDAEASRLEQEGAAALARAGRDQAACLAWLL